MIYKVRVMVFAELELPEKKAEQEKAMAAFEALALKTVEDGALAKSTRVKLRLREAGEEL